MSDKNIELEESSVTSNASAADPMPKIDNTVPGQTGSAEDLGGPLTKTAPGTEETPGKKVSAKASKISNRVNQGAGAPDPMPTLQGSAPGQAGMKESEEVEPEMSIDVKDDVEALLRGEEFSEEFKFKASTIFEAAVKAKVVEEVEKLEKVYEEKLEAQVAEMKESLETKVEAHLEYATEQWVNENKIAIDSGLRSDLTEEFILGLKNLFEEHYVDIPEDKYDVLGEMSEKLDQMEVKLNEQIETNVELNQTIGNYIKNGVIAEISEGLAQTQKEKLTSLAEGVEFVSEESYREKIETIKENYFPKTQASSTEDLVEQKTETTVSDPSSPMAAYEAALRRWTK
jgi:hypothetical protein|tara:strand:- start:623 stop:1651 length:1029 start_codon:yes stop_codon:yes gene_type:complete